MVKITHRTEMYVAKNILFQKLHEYSETRHDSLVKLASLCNNLMKK